MLKKSEKTITNKELVETWGTQKNKEFYLKNNKVPNSMKKSLLNRAKLECEIKDLGSGCYFIESIREFKTPTQFTLIENTIYEYLCPLILNQSIKSYHNEQNKLEISLIKYYNLLQSISFNYNNIRYGSKHSCEILEIDKRNHKDFFSETSSYLKNTLENSLEYLRKMGAIKWYKFRMVAYREKEFGESDDVKFNIDLSYSHRRATEEEIRYELDIKNEIMKELDIKDDKECYFSHKSFKFKEKMRQKLSEKKIKYFYDAYEVYYTSIERCLNILKLFKIQNMSEISSALNKYIIENIKQNAKNRSQKYLISPKKNINVETYLDDYIKLVDNAINLDAEYLVVKKDLDMDYKMCNGKLVVTLYD